MSWWSAMSGEGGHGHLKRRGERLPTAEESRLWDLMTRDVAQFARDRGAAPVCVPEPPPAPDEAPAGETGKNDLEAARAKRAAHLLAPRTATKPSGPAPLSVDDISGIDRRTADRFRRGKMSIDARLDLHGMTRQAAQDALLGFVERAVSRDLRCVLVITGKGYQREEGGVLRRDLPHWLNLPSVRRKIVAVTQAQQRHGGGGAFYLLLRRRRTGPAD